MSLADAVALALEAGCQAPTPAPASPVSTLTVEALGPLRIRRDGTALDREAWASAKPRELLLFLLCHQDGRTREQVGVAFWPEASAEQVRNNFHVTLHRLRKTLGGARWVNHSGDQYVLDPGLRVEFDATTFERDVAAGLVRLKRDGEAVPLTSALGLYRGDFLEHEAAGDWHLAVRDRLRHKYLTALTALAEYDMQRERWAEAADSWRTLIVRDGLDEQAYRGLMTCHARLGQRSRVQELYRRLAEVLDRELEASPGADTTKLYRQLVT